MPKQHGHLEKKDTTIQQAKCLSNDKNVPIRKKSREAEHLVRHQKVIQNEHKRKMELKLKLDNKFKKADQRKQMIQNIRIKTKLENHYYLFEKIMGEAENRYYKNADMYKNQKEIIRQNIWVIHNFIKYELVTND